MSYIVKIIEIENQNKFVLRIAYRALREKKELEKKEMKKLKKYLFFLNLWE